MSALTPPKEGGESGKKTGYRHHFTAVFVQLDSFLYHAAKQ